MITPPFKKLSHGYIQRIPLLTLVFTGVLYSIPWFRGAFYPLQIGDNVVIEEDSVINASSVGSYVHVGKNCVIVSRQCPGKSFCVETSRFESHSLKVCFVNNCLVCSAIIFCACILTPPPHTHTHTHPQSRSCILKDCCKVLDNTVLPPETVVPPFTVFGGSPGTILYSHSAGKCQK